MAFPLQMDLMSAGVVFLSFFEGLENFPNDLRPSLLWSVWGPEASDLIFISFVGLENVLHTEFLSSGAFGPEATQSKVIDPVRPRVPLFSGGYSVESPGLTTSSCASVRQPIWAQTLLS